MGFLRTPSTIAATLRPGVSKVMDPRRWVAPRDSPADPLPPVPNKGHGSSYDQKILTELLPVSRPPIPHVQPLSSNPIVPISDEVKLLEFEPVSSESSSTPTRPVPSNLPKNMGIRHKAGLPPDKCRILEDASSSFSYENANFVEAVRNAPFIPSSATLDYSEPLRQIQIPYVDPPIEFADSASAPTDDMNLYSFSTPSP
jgi:hypothetical protein